jgi:hypothetical protein
LTQYTTDDDSNKYYCHDEVSRHLKNLTEDDWKRIDKELTKFESDHGEFFEKYAKDPFSYFDKAWKSLESGTLRWPRSYDFFTFLFYRPKGGKGVRGVILKYFSDDIKRVGTTDHNLSELWKPNPEDGKAFYDHEKRKKSRDNINEKSKSKDSIVTDAMSYASYKDDMDSYEDDLYPIDIQTKRQAIQDCFEDTEKTDPLMYKVIDMYLNGVKPKAIAEHYRIDVSIVNSEQRKFRDKVRNYAKKEHELL